MLESGPAFAAGRRNDPKSFPLSSEAIGRIPKKFRDQSKTETFQTGGVNIYSATIDGHNGDSTHSIESFLFSIPLEHVERLLPNTSKNFNFPGRVPQCMLANI